MKTNPQAPNHNQRLGRWGEEQAAAYLRAQGYRVLAANLRTPYGEIDLLAQKEEETVFVEVKTRSNQRFGLPEEAVTPLKRSRMEACAAWYAAENGLENWQLDVIAIETGQPPRLEHFPNV